MVSFFDLLAQPAASSDLSLPKGIYTGGAATDQVGDLWLLVGRAYLPWVVNS